MSPNQPQEVATTSPPAAVAEEKETPSRFHGAAVSQHHTKPRDVVRLFQCRICSRPLQNPVTLPCGKSICRSCLPETRARANITYPAAPERQQGFPCPFADCGKEHALDDCGQDVILNKAVHHIRAQMEHGKEQSVQLELSTYIRVQDPWEVAAIGSLKEHDPFTGVIRGASLTATWTLAEQGKLTFEADVSYGEVPVPSLEELDQFEVDVLKKAQEATRTEMDCQVCYGIFNDPLTTACGHTFCRPCLQRISDHSRHCPICRHGLALNPLLNRKSCPSNESITKIIKTFWHDEVEARMEALVAEETRLMEDFDTPLFPVTLSFPTMPTFLHIFEPRYRLMIRRAMEGDRTFGVVLPRRGWGGDGHFLELGTLLRIVNIQYFADGRSLIETVGVSRFRVVRHGYMDGYVIGHTERIDDISLEEEEATEAAEVGQVSDDAAHDTAQPLAGSDSETPLTADQEGFVPQALEDLDRMPTQALMHFAKSFVERMREQSVPWLTHRLRVVSECPSDPAVFPWWFASMLPVKELEKYRLLETKSVRERLKICCSWILEWETNRWSLHDCVIL